MNVYEFRHDSDHFEWLNAAGMDGKRWLDFTQFALLADPAAGRWLPVKFKSHDPHEEGYAGFLPTADFVGLSGWHFALDPRAMAKVSELMSRYGELLPVDHPGRADFLYWFHCTTLIDAMDESRSVLKWFPDGKKVMSVKRLWVHPEKLRDAMLIHIPQNGPFLLCTDTFKQNIEALGLTGLKFTLKWSDEPAGMKQISDWEQRALFDMPPFPVPIP